ncbi:MAG: hypothetical protein KBC12_01695 [Candidatus Pacebacteria bacterium]|nr:hypothetical protein [Candidatus Paceibacterota bacterium]MBP9851400.1 hypothetical protein [Candidatus Paceibacterota bacterium]
MNIKNKGSITLAISILVALALIGGGAVYYKNNLKSSTNTLNSSKENSIGILDTVKSTFQNTSTMSPKEIFIARNTAMYAAKSFEELQAVGLKYDSVAKIQEDADQTKYMNDEKKKALFGFAQVFLTPTQELINIEEKIDGDKATVTAETKAGKELEATFIKEGGVWKLEEDKIVNPGNK